MAKNKFNELFSKLRIMLSNEFDLCIPENFNNEKLLFAGNIMINSGKGHTRELILN